MSRPWIKVDVALLDDERFLSMTPAMVGVWTKAYLLVARDGDRIKNRARLAWLLGRYGVKNPTDAVKRLEAAGWIEDLGDGEVTIRGFNKHQSRYRGESDLPGARQTRADSRRSAPIRADDADRGEERRGEETKSRARPREAEPRRAARSNGDLRPIAEIIGDFDAITEKRT